MNFLDIISKYKIDFAHGLWITLQLSFYIWVIGIVFGILIGSLGAKFKNAIGVPSRAISFFLGSIPILVILFWLHFPLQFTLDVVIDGFYTTIFALALVNTFLVADLIRNSLLNFPNQYIIAARAVGLSAKDTILKIQLPLVFRQVIPNVLLIQVVMMQSTLFASLISVDEIFRICQRVNSEVYRPVEIYTALAIMFLLICMPLNGFAYWLKIKYTRDHSEK